jgi:hypothetical protein
VTSLRQKHYGAARKHGFAEVFFEVIRDVIRDLRDKRGLSVTLLNFGF